METICLMDGVHKIHLKDADVAKRYNVSLTWIKENRKSLSQAEAHFMGKRLSPRCYRVDILDKMFTDPPCPQEPLPTSEGSLKRPRGRLCL